MWADLRPTVRVGQVWASNHLGDRKAGKRQQRLVVSVAPTHAELLTPGERTSTKVKLRISGDRSTIPGYRLIEEPQDG
jgi:hypothetical protein